MYKFNWDGFTATDFANYCAQMENEKLYEMDYVGCARVGELCFDLSLRTYYDVASGVEDPDKLVLTFDLYVGGVDPKQTTGDHYAYSRLEPDFPYDYAEGKDFADTCIDMSYEDFVAMAEAAFTNYIDHSEYTDIFDLPSKAAAPLHIW